MDQVACRVMIQSHASPMDWLTLMSAVVAAVAAIFAGTWAWVDRPQLGWNLQLRAWQGKLSNGEVRAVGTAVAYNVEIKFVPRTPGVSALPPKFEPAMSAGSEPIFFQAQEDLLRYIEIRWIRLRPYQQFGTRVAVHSREWENWHWSWWSVRPLLKDGKWWKIRLVRRRGSWRPRPNWVAREIPESQS